MTENSSRRVLVGTLAAAAVFGAVGAPPAAAATLASSAALAPNLTLTTTTEEHVVRRFAAAPTPDVYKRALTIGWSAWIDEQFAMTNSTPAMAAWLKKFHYWFPTGDMGMKELNAWAAETGFSLSGVPILHAGLQRTYTMYLRQMLSPAKVREAWTEFWLDNFSMPYVDKYPGDIFDTDRDVRDNALTSVPNVIKTVYSRGLVYSALDNNQNKKTGINENLARETMEIHLLGPGNYTERDVEQLAILLSGIWSHPYHDYYARVTGEHMVTSAPLVIRGRSYPNSTLAEATASWAKFLEDTLADPASKRHLSKKIARRFVMDEPTPALIDRLAANMTANGGDIKALTKAIIASPEFSQSVGKKFRRPSEYLTVLLGARKPEYVIPQINPWFPTSTFKDKTDRGGQIWTSVPYAPLTQTAAIAAQAGHHLRKWEPADGYPDVAEYWMSPGSVLPVLSAAARNGDVDKELKPTLTWTQATGVSTRMPTRVRAITLVRALTGYTPSGEILNLVSADLANPNLTAEQRVAAAVRTTMASPLAWMR